MNHPLTAAKPEFFSTGFSGVTKESLILLCFAVKLVMNTGRCSALAKFVTISV